LSRFSSLITRPRLQPAAGYCWARRMWIFPWVRLSVCGSVRQNGPMYFKLYATKLVSRWTWQVGPVPVEGTWSGSRYQLKDQRSRTSVRSSVNELVNMIF